MSLLDDILATKREEVAARRVAEPPSVLRERPLWAEPRRGFRAALAARPVPAVIAELKRASPSRGEIRAAYDPAAIARGYAAAGAAALSVLTDGPFFGGALEHLAAARAASGLPCLRKDFLIDPYQIEEARAFGADAVLLVVAGVTARQGADLLAAARAAGLDVLVEVHSEAELERAAGLGATLIGINNRDLATFDVSLATAERLAPRAPSWSARRSWSGPTRARPSRSGSGVREGQDLRRVHARRRPRRHRCRRRLRGAQLPPRKPAPRDPRGGARDRAGGTRRGAGRRLRRHAARARRGDRGAGRPLRAPVPRRRGRRLLPRLGLADDQGDPRAPGRRSRRPRRALSGRLSPARQLRRRPGRRHRRRARPRSGGRAARRPPVRGGRPPPRHGGRDGAHAAALRRRRRVRGGCQPGEEGPCQGRRVHPPRQSCLT